MTGAYVPSLSTRAYNILVNQAAEEARKAYKTKQSPNFCTLRRNLDVGAWASGRPTVLAEDLRVGGLLFVHLLSSVASQLLLDLVALILGLCPHG